MLRDRGGTIRRVDGERHQLGRGAKESGIEQGIVRQLAKAEWSPMAAVKHCNNGATSGHPAQAARLVGGVGQLEIRHRRAQLRYSVIRIGHHQIISFVRCAATHVERALKTSPATESSAGTLLIQAKVSIGVLAEGLRARR